MSNNYEYVKPCPECGSEQTYADAPEYGVVIFECDECGWLKSPDAPRYILRDYS